MDDINERPTCVEDGHLEYLDWLRESGQTNMFGAGAYIVRKFDELNRCDAGIVLTYWMHTFEQRTGGE